MGIHLHISALELTTSAAYIIIFGFLWRSLSAHLAGSDNPFFASVGKAMSFIY